MFQKAADIGSHNCYGGTKKTANKYVMTRERMLTMMNEGVKIRYKAVTNQVFKVVGILVELGIDIGKPKVYLEASPSIR